VWPRTNDRSSARHESRWVNGKRGRGVLDSALIAYLQQKGKVRTALSGMDRSNAAQGEPDEKYDCMVLPKAAELGLPTSSNNE
jgi:hypothetical protein